MSFLLFLDMVSLRLLSVLLFLTASLFTREAHGRPKRPTTAQAEARNEAASPGLSSQLRQSHRVVNYLGDVLQLNYAQWHALTVCTAAERVALVLAAAPEDALAAQRQYLLAVRRVLAASQMDAYVALRQQLADTLLPLDGTELVATR